MAKTAEQILAQIISYAKETINGFNENKEFFSQENRPTDFMDCGFIDGQYDALSHILSLATSEVSEQPDNMRNLAELFKLYLYEDGSEFFQKGVWKLVKNEFYCDWKLYYSDGNITVPVVQCDHNQIRLLYDVYSVDEKAMLDTIFSVLLPNEDLQFLG